MMTLFKNWN